MNDKEIKKVLTKFCSEMTQEYLETMHEDENSTNKPFTASIKDGVLSFIYDDAQADLLTEGVSTIERVSNVEPVPGGWKAFMKNGVVLGPYPLRQEALNAEIAYLEKEMFEEK
jgi:hypothetical protein